MKKIFLALTAVICLLALTACNKILSNENAQYYVLNITGSDEVTMTPIATNDSRVNAIKDAIKDALYLYIAEITLTEVSGAATIIHDIDDELVGFNAGLGVEIKKTGAENWVGQSVDSGKIENLTTNTLFIPPFNAALVDGIPNFANKAVALEAGSFYVVFAEFAGNIKTLGLIKR